ncbi:MAG: hypothetical protein LIO74_07675 [Ruminococcus sp.]|nr:hypothetical protein [Ruminococcus sp.]
MAKLMTAYLVAQQLECDAWSLDTILTAGNEVDDVSGAVIWLVVEEQMTVSDLLKGLIIGNAGDAAVVLAVAISGSISDFVMDMNACAFDLGLRHTYFSSPHGSNEDGQYTTAYDLGLLCCALSKEEILTPYFQTWRDFLRGEETELVNENILTRTDDTSIGFKACHTETDGWSLAAGAKRNGMTCIAVVIGCANYDDRYALAKSLLRKGFAGWKVVQPAFSAEFLYPMTVHGGVEDAVLIEPGELQGIIIPKDCNNLETVLVLPKFMDAPIKKGQKLGTVAFYQGDTLLYETAVLATENVGKRNFWDALSKIVVKNTRIVIRKII